MARGARGGTTSVGTRGWARSRKWGMGNGWLYVGMNEVKRDYYTDDGDYYMDDGNGAKWVAGSR